MRYLCFGVGAIGTYIGGSLVLGGDEVIFLERPEYVNGLRRNGISLDLNGEKHHLKDISVAGTIDEALMAGPFDVVIFAIKSFDTQKAIEEIKPYHVALPPFLCLQNGVENEVFLSSALGEAKVIHGTVSSAIGRNGAGDIVLERLRGVGISARHGLSEKILSSFNHAGLQAKLYDQPVAMKWSKMLTNLLANATSAILNLTPLEIYSQPDLFRLEIRMVKEALKVMRAQNIPVVGLPGTPVNWLARVIEYLPTQISQPLLKKTLGTGRGGKMPSFHIDLYAGRKLSEVEYLNGTVVRAGERLGVRTPVNRVLTQTLIGLADGRLNKDDFAGQPQKLLSLILDEERSSI
jgi:2-dehydropantoate 2-reductase